MSDQAAHDQIQAFEAAYEYDASYMHDLLERSPEGFAAFAAAQPMTSFRDRLSAEAHYVAAITVMQEEDCGTCLQLNLKLALEAGVDRELLRQILRAPEELAEEFLDVRRHTLSVLAGESPDEACAKRIEERYGAAAFAELALCIVGVRMYPALKRALLKANHCPIASIDI